MGPKMSDLALARAARQPQGQTQAIQAADIGGGWGFLGFELVPVKSQDGEKLAAMLVAVGTKQSLITQANLTIVKAPIAPLAEVLLENLRSAFEKASAGGQEAEPTT